VKLADLTPTSVAVIGGLAALAAFALYAWKKGGIGAAAVDAVGSITSGAVGEIGATVGLPKPSQTTTDPAVARWIIDHPLGGVMAASSWAGAPAFLKALTMPAGSGTPPPVGSELAARFPELPQASYDETERLAKRTPQPITPSYGISSDSWGLPI